MSKIVPAEIIEQKIFYIRNHKIMVDRDLAQLYGVETKYLNRQVRRNKERFPDDFMFCLTKREKDELVTICHRFKTMKHSASLPCVFTEYGVAMLASVLKSDTAARISVLIIKAFIRLREMAATHKELFSKLQDLEKKVGIHDEEIRLIVEAIRKLMAPEQERPKGKMGFYIEK